ncbi:MAG: hypothetical protein HFE86_05505 [Clostridiales bacterium]|nr:hypothetical protein [Clostridiales bacterium]
METEPTCQDCKYFHRHYHKHRSPFARRLDKYISMSEGQCRFSPDTVKTENHPVCERFTPLPPQEEENDT